MNQQQRKYAAGRLEQLYKSKALALLEEYKIPAKRLTPKERLKLIKSGKVPFAKGVNEVNQTTSLSRLFDFSSFEHGEGLKEGHPKELDKLKKKEG